MSIMRLKKNMAKYTKWAVYVFAALFIVGSVFFLPGVNPRNPSVVAASAPSPVAYVNGQEVSRDMFNASLAGAWQQAQFRGSLTPMTVPFTKQQALQEIEEHLLQLEAAQREGIRVSNKKVNERLEQQAQFTLSMQKAQQGEKAFRRKLREEFGTEENFVNQIIDKVPAEQHDAIRDMLLLEGLRQKVQDGVKATEKEYRETTIKARARMILVRSSTPPPPPGNSASDSKSEDPKARQKAEDLLKEIKSGADFAKVAKEKSDDKPTQDKDGLIEGFLPPKPTDKQKEDAQWFGKGEKKFTYGDEFEEVVFKKLKPGDVSDVFKGTGGYFIVKLEDRKEVLPDDYTDVDYQCEEKNHEHTWTNSFAEDKECPVCKSKKIELVKTTPAPKPPADAPKDAPKPPPTREYLCKEKKHTHSWTEKGKEADACPKCGAKKPKIKLVLRHKDHYLRNFESTKQQEAWTKYMENLKKSAKTEIFDPEMKAYELQRKLFTVRDEKERRQYLNDVIKFCKESLQYSDRFIQPAVLHYQIAQAYQQLGDKKEQLKALQAAIDRSQPVAELHVELGRLYKEQKQTKKAVEEFKKASRATPSQQFWIHTQLAEEFKQLKRKDLEEKEKKLAKPPGPSANAAVEPSVSSKQ